MDQRAKSPGVDRAVGLLRLFFYTRGATNVSPPTAIPAQKKLGLLLPAFPLVVMTGSSWLNRQSLSYPATPSSLNEASKGVAIFQGEGARKGGFLRPPFPPPAFLPSPVTPPAPFSRRPQHAGSLFPSSDPSPAQLHQPVEAQLSSAQLGSQSPSSLPSHHCLWVVTPPGGSPCFSCPLFLFLFLSPSLRLPASPPPPSAPGKLSPFRLFPCFHPSSLRPTVLNPSGRAPAGRPLSARCIIIILPCDLRWPEPRWGINSCRCGKSRSERGRPPCARRACETADWQTSSRRLEANRWRPAATQPPAAATQRSKRLTRLRGGALLLPPLPLLPLLPPPWRGSTEGD